MDTGRASRMPWLVALGASLVLSACGRADLSGSPGGTEGSSSSSGASGGGTSSSGGSGSGGSSSGPWGSSSGSGGSSSGSRPSSDCSGTIDYTGWNSGGSGGNPLTGTFTIAVVPPDGTTPGTASFSGKVYGNGHSSDPSSMSWEERAHEYPCRLLEGVPAASGPQNSWDVGTLTVSGLGTEPVTVSAAGGAYATAIAAYPPFAEGDTIRLVSSGNRACRQTGSWECAPFEMVAKGIAPLTVRSSEVAFRKAGPTSYGGVTLTWDPPGDVELADVMVILDVLYRDGKRGRLDCSTWDSGSVAIPASIFTWFAAEIATRGLETAPALEITRRNQGTACMSWGEDWYWLHVDSPRALPVTIEGITCKVAADCGSGSCDAAKGLCAR